MMCAREPDVVQMLWNLRAGIVSGTDHRQVTAPARGGWQQGPQQADVTEMRLQL